MKKIFLTLCLILIASPSFAGLPIAQWSAIDSAAVSAATQLGPSANIYQAISANALTSYQTNSFYHSGVQVTRTLAPTLELAAPLASSVGSSGAKIFTKKALGLLGPVATAVLIGMTAYDLYEMTKNRPTDFPLLEAATNNYTVQNFGNGGTPISNDTYSQFEVGDNFNFSPTDPRGVTQVLSSTNAAGCDMNLPASYYSGDIYTYYFIGRMGSIGGPSCTFGDQSQRNLTGRIVFRFQATPFIGEATPASQAEFEAKLGAETILSPEYMAELEKAFKEGLDTGTATLSPSPEQIKDLAAKETIQAATAATQTAVDTAQANFDTAPTPENKQILYTLKAQQAAQEAAKAQEELLNPPAVPASGDYDTSVDLPVKKLIPELLSTFISSSPLVSMVSSFTMTASGTGVIPIVNIYGQNLEFNFTRWEGTLQACGGVLLVIMHGFAVLIVVRGW